MRSENPLHLSFWLGDVDPRPLALFRIALGVTLLHDLGDLAFDLRTFLTDDGMLPRGVQGEPLAWSIFNWVGSPSAVGAVFCVGLAVVIAFTLGYRPRVSAGLSWLFLTSVHTRNLYITDGGDDLIRNLLFLSMFTNLGGCYSVDARLGRRVAGVPALGLRFMQLHLALLYFVAARWKFRAGWLKKPIIYQTLQLTGFLRPPGLWLMKSPLACRAVGAITVFLEWSFAFLAFSPVRIRTARFLAICAGLGVQIGILVTMRVGIFTEAMIVSSLLFVQPEWLDRLEAMVRRREPSVGIDGSATTPSTLGLPWSEVPRARALAFAFLGVQFLALAWGPFMGGRFPPPRWLLATRSTLWLQQPFSLFDKTYDIPNWEAPGTTARGDEVEVLSVAAPGLAPTGPGWRFDRWYKFNFKEHDHPFRFPALGRFLCRTYEERTGVPLTSLTIVERLIPPALPGMAPNPALRRERWREDCRAP